MRNKVRLGFHYHVPAMTKDGGIYMPGYLGCFIDSLADFCEEVICFLHSPRVEEFGHMNYKILSDKVKLVDIGPHSSVFKRILKSKSYTLFIKRYANNIDILLVRGPSPLLPALVNQATVPTALLLVGDYVAGVNDLFHLRWRKEIIRLWSYWNKWGQDRAARHSLTFVNSRVLYNELKGKVSNLHEIRTTTLTKDSFFIRSDTCQSKPCRLLYVGRMDRAKGLVQMVEAVALLTSRGENVVLDLVGWPAPKDPIIKEIELLALTKGIRERVKYHGPRQLGPELFNFYKQADIFLIASIASEGFPRVIWEAMANSLPVIASRVGSIPAFVENAVELIPPRQVEALADSISKLIHNPELRQNQIIRGLELARRNTLEIQVGAMVAEIKSWLEVKHD